MRQVNYGVDHSAQLLVSKQRLVLLKLHGLGEQVIEVPQFISLNDLVERYIRLAIHFRRLTLLEGVFQLAIAKLAPSVLIRDK